jgi:uncharacterized membrane protein YhaH (DUF805 family)
MNEPTRYWFPAKRYGYGWGFPTTWQGIVVLLAFLAAVVAGVILLPPAQQPLLFIAYMVVQSAMLLLVCVLKGEPARWRWGTGPKD